MAPTQAAGSTAPEPGAGGVTGQDSPELWGNDGMVGDGRYRLTRRLGRGGMAEVFAAEDVRLGRIVAVKLLRADLAEDPVAKARFTREAQAVAGLNHQAVVAVYDSGEDVLGNGDSVPFIVMEYVEGHTIRDLLVNDDPPPVDKALLIVSGVLEALAYSHQHGIVHRDIKPANVIITHSGAVKVMDFGIARALHGGTTMTQTGMVMGTPQYLSPEQALGRAVDARSDLYATGCLLYELLALRPPFTGDSPLSVVYQHVQDDPRPPSEISDRVPPELDGLVLRALAKEPDDRYQSAGEMSGEIQYALRMLHEEGGNTGTWATGHLASAFAQGTTAAAAGYAGPRGGYHTPPQGVSMLPPAPAFGGHDGGAAYGGSRWRKPVLVAAAAVLAIAAGVFGAMNVGGNASSDNRPETSPSVQVDDDTPGSSSAPQQDDTAETSTGAGEENPDETGTGEQPLPPQPSYTPSPSDAVSTEPSEPEWPPPGDHSDEEPETTPSTPPDTGDSSSGSGSGGSGDVGGEGGGDTSGGSGPAGSLDGGEAGGPGG